MHCTKLQDKWLFLGALTFIIFAFYTMYTVYTYHLGRHLRVVNKIKLKFFNTMVQEYLIMLKRNYDIEKSLYHDIMEKVPTKEKYTNKIESQLEILDGYMFKIDKAKNNQVRCEILSDWKQQNKRNREIAYLNADDMPWDNYNRIVEKLIDNQYVLELELAKTMQNSIYQEWRNIYADAAQELLEAYNVLSEINLLFQKLRAAKHNEVLFRLYALLRKLDLFLNQPIKFLY